MMLAAFQLGVAGGQRAFAPLAAVAVAAARNRHVHGDTLSPLGHPLVATAITLLAAAEMVGDKHKSAPDRIVAAGLVARLLSSAIAGAVITSKRRWAGAAVAGLTAVTTAFPGWALRTRVMPRWGQTLSGFIEDAAVLAIAGRAVRAGSSGQDSSSTS